MVVINTAANIFQVNANKLRRLLDTVDLQEHPDSYERTGAPVLWLSCESQRDVWELFSDNSYLSAILDRQRLMVAASCECESVLSVQSYLTKIRQPLYKNLQKCYSFQGWIDTDKSSQYDERIQGKSQGRPNVTWRTHLWTTLFQKRNLNYWALSHFDP